MANWYGHARSNYFRVKDKAEFVRWAESIGDLEIIEDDAGRVGLLSSSENGGWPYSRYAEEKDQEEEIDLLGGIASHLQEGSVAVLVEIGAERSRYLTGYAHAVNSKGEVRRVSLDDIYEAAKPLGKEVLDA